VKIHEKSVDLSVPADREKGKECGGSDFRASHGREKFDMALDKTIASKKSLPENHPHHRPDIGRRPRPWTGKIAIVFRKL
jgi:hypothetical protein